MLFDEEFLSSIDEDPAFAAVQACNMAFECFDDDAESGGSYSESEFEAMLEAYALVDSILEASQLPSPAMIVSLDGDLQENSISLATYLRAVITAFEGHISRKKIEKYKQKFKSVLSSTFAYEFSQGDLEKIQTLINELRTEITASNLFEPNHKQRLLKRLEKMQSEMHKRISDLDRFWGLIGDAGVVIGKFGNDAKPIVDRVKEIADIVWRTQSRAEELPTDTPLPLLSDNRTVG